MKRFLIPTIFGGVLLSISSCFTYRVVQDPTDASPKNELRVTTTDGGTFDLHSWEVDSIGTIMGVDRSQGSPYRPWRFSAHDIKSIEQREFDYLWTIVGSIVFGIPTALFLYMAAT